jgi:prevent-host-death family protein
MGSMETYNIHEAKTNFSKLINRVMAGEELLIGKAGKPIAKITPYIEQREPRKFGIWEGRDDIWVADDAFSPEFEQEIIDMFEGKYETPLDGGDK